MADHASSADPAVQRQLDRLSMLSPGRDVLGLERITRLLDRLGNPQRALPPVFHVAGTNGKGSTCAFLRAALEASGRQVHVYTSPHLVRFNERIRVADELIDDPWLAELLDEVLSVSEDIQPSFFEVTTAVAFLAFARIQADACVIEVGLGGRLDATNVIEHPLVTGIAQLGIDHQSFLGEKLEQIAAEKAGIAKPGVPLVTLAYPGLIASRVGQVAVAAGAQWLPKGQSWDAAVYQQQLHYRDGAGKMSLPLPRLPGSHQGQNAALAVAMLRSQDRLTVPESALRAAMQWAEWPARLQRLRGGALVERLPAGAELWLDGGHNPAAARVVADYFRPRLAGGRPFQIILGLLENKDASGYLSAFRDLQPHLTFVPVPGHPHHPTEVLAMMARTLGLSAGTAETPAEALQRIEGGGTANRAPVVLIAGSLYLAGRVLEANGTPPT